MGMRLTSGQNVTDPLTGLPVILGQIRTTQDGNIRVSQTTGEAPHGINQQPGTDPNGPGNDDPGVPRGFDEVPETGPLT